MARQADSRSVLLGMDDGPLELFLALEGRNVRLRLVAIAKGNLIELGSEGSAACLIADYPVGVLLISA